MTEKTESFRSMVLRLIVSEGLGVEDIAVKVGRPLKRIQKEVSRLRSDGRLSETPRRNKPERKSECKTDIILRMAREGSTVYEMCDAVGSEEKSVSSIISRLRREGKITGAIPFRRKASGDEFRRQERIAMAQAFARTAGLGKDVPADMLAQIAAFDPARIKRLPTMYAFGAEQAKPNLSNNAMIRVGSL